jgi:hypothetical protein
MNFTTTSPLGETSTITTSLPALPFVLCHHTLYEIFTISIALIFVIGIFLTLASALDHLLLLSGITDKSSPSLTSGLLHFLDPYRIAAVSARALSSVLDSKI